MSRSIEREQGLFRLTTNKDGSQSIDVRADHLEQPSDAYLADWFHASCEDRTCEFTFGKRSVRRDHLVTVLALSLPLGQMKPLAETFKGPGDGTGFQDLLETMVTTHSLRVGGHLALEKGVSETTKEHSLAANFATLGFSDADASLSFYRVPPTLDLRRLDPESLQRVRIIPVVRVDTTSGILLEFVRSVRQFAEDDGTK